MTFITPKTLVSKIRRTASSGVSSKIESTLTPALFTTRIKAAEALDARLDRGLDAPRIGHVERLDGEAIRVFLREARVGPPHGSDHVPALGGEVSGG